MKQRALRPVFLFLLFWVGVCAAAGASEPKLRASVDKAIVETGDKLRFTIELETDPSMDLKVPDVGDRILGFRVVDFGEDSAEIIEGKKILRRWYELESDLSGSYILPEVTLAYSVEGEAKQIKTSEIFVEVKAPEAKAEGEAKEEGLRDIKPLVGIGPLVPYWVWAVLGGVLLLVGLAFWLWKRRKTASVATPALPPDALALNLFASLRESRPSTPEEIKSYYYQLSLAVRQYFEGRYGVPVTDMTLEEIQRNVTVDIKEELWKEWLRLLKDCDWVKFTDHQPTGEAIEEVLTQAESFVRETRASGPERADEAEEMVV